MNWAGRLAVDQHLRVCHCAVKHKPNDLSSPARWDIETQAILSLLAGDGVRLAFTITPIVVSAKALLLPVGRHRNLGPGPRAPACGAKEIPHHGVVFPGAGQIANLGLIVIVLASDE